MISKRQMFTRVLVLAGVGLGGCVEEVELDDELDLGATPGPVDPLGPVEVASADNGAAPYLDPVVECSSHNVIGVLNSGFTSCAIGAVPGWTWHKMFETFTPDLATWYEAPPLGLVPFCIYEFAGDPTVDDYDDLFAAITAAPNISIDAVAPDCRGQALMGTGLNDPSVSDALAQAFDAAIQWVDGNELDADREFARVAIVDGVSQLAFDNPAVNPVNEHGLFMGDIVGHIACADEDPDCLAAISYHAAMVRSEFELANWWTGDEWGTMGDLAMAIVAAVRKHRLNRLSDPNSPDRLVINLSLGWAADEALTTTDPNRGPVRALQEALYYATCNGALVFAASGNSSDAACGASEVGAVAPAVFETMPVLSETACLARGYVAIDTNNYPVFGDPRPLVQAVAGLDGHDDPIANARPGSLPELAAYASQVTVDTGTGFTTPLTGTSVSAAVASATAALMWSHAPETTPDQIVQLMFDSAYPTGLASDFGFAGLGEVHRLSVCDALVHACDSVQNPLCPNLSCQDQTPPADGHLGNYFAAVDAVLDDPSTVIWTFGNSPGSTPMCVPPTWDEQMDPQPEHPMCPHCAIEKGPGMNPSDDKLEMSIDSEYVGLVAAIRLVTYDDEDNPTEFELDERVVNSVNDTSVDVTEVYIEAPDAVTASLTFMLVGGADQNGPIPVGPPPV